MVVTDFKSTTAPASSITFSGVNIGAASADRAVVVGVVARGNAGGIVVSSVTVSGISTTQRAAQLNGYGSGGGALPGGIGLDGFPGAVIVRMWKP